LNNNAIGYQRDAQVVALVETLGAMQTEQIGICLFQQRYWLRKAQERLQRLFKSGRLRRTRVDDGYAYFVERQALLDHTLALSWVYVWLRQKLATWESLEWQREKDFGILRCDAFATIRNRPLGTTRHYFVEVDRSANEFDKVTKYNRLYESGAYESEPWVKTAKRFPVVLCVTTRVRAVRKTVERDNRAGLRFDVRTLEDIRGECRGGRYEA
jgi:hypothetical protein